MSVVWLGFGLKWQAVDMMRRLPKPELERESRLMHRLGTVFVVLAVLMIPWSIYLGMALPHRELARHYDAAWAGFDVGLAAALGWTAYAALRRSRWLPVAASINATMLIVDAWFDVMTSPTSKDLWVAVGSALLLELPLAGVCLWLAVNGQRVVEWREELDLQSQAR